MFIKLGFLTTLALLLLIIFFFRNHPFFARIYPSDSTISGSFVSVRKTNEYTNYETGSQVSYSRDKLYFKGKPFKIHYESKTGDLLSTFSDQITYSLKLNLANPTFLILAGDVDNDGAFVIAEEQNQTLNVKTVANYRFGFLKLVSEDGTIHELENWRTLKELDNGQYSTLIVENKSLIDFKTSTFYNLQDFTSEILHFISFSPDKKRVVRFASLFNSPTIIENELSTNKQSIFLIDPIHQWYDFSEQVDHDWLLSYFEWSKDNSAQYNLKRRKTSNPRPYQGRVNIFERNKFEINWKRVRLEGFENLIRFLKTNKNINFQSCETSDSHDQQRFQNCWLFKNDPERSVQLSMLSNTGLVLTTNTQNQAMAKQIKGEIDLFLSLNTQYLRPPPQQKSLASFFKQELDKNTNGPALKENRIQELIEIIMAQRNFDSYELLQALAIYFKIESQGPKVQNFLQSLKGPKTNKELIRYFEELL